MTSWWKVEKEDWVFMVLVVEGRVAACAMSVWIKIGDPWKDVRSRLSTQGFTCTMESPP